MPFSAGVPILASRPCIEQPLSRPAWRPDGAAIAHTDSDHNLEVSDLQGRTLWSFHPGPAPRAGSVADYIDEIRWDPSAKRLAFLMAGRIYVVNADGSHLQAIEFHNFVGVDLGLSIRSFAWSPDGRQFVFRSEAGKKCNYAALAYKFDTGSFPCIFSRNVFTAAVDGSHLTHCPTLSYAIASRPAAPLTYTHSSFSELNAASPSQRYATNGPPFATL
jgi:Tol biopolymer transport system component